MPKEEIYYLMIRALFIPESGFAIHYKAVKDGIWKQGVGERGGGGGIKAHNITNSAKIFWNSYGFEKKPSVYPLPVTYRDLFICGFLNTIWNNYHIIINKINASDLLAGTIRYTPIKRKSSFRLIQNFG